MDRKEFEGLVAAALDNLPTEFKQKMENVEVVIEDWPTREQLKQAKQRHPAQLLGLYQGVPRTRRGRGYGLVLPDKITIFQRPIEAQCSLGYEIGAKIQEVVQHEIGHHFGLDEESLRRIESQKRKDR